MSVSLDGKEVWPKALGSVDGFSESPLPLYQPQFPCLCHENSNTPACQKHLEGLGEVQK